MRRFSDLNVVHKDQDESKEVMPFINNLKRKYHQGCHTLVSVFGGGPSNSEYEFLTGNSASEHFH